LGDAREAVAARIANQFLETDLEKPRARLGSRYLARFSDKDRAGNIVALHGPLRCDLHPCKKHSWPSRILSKSSLKKAPKYFCFRSSAKNKMSVLGSWNAGHLLTGLHRNCRYNDDEARLPEQIPICFFPENFRQHA
jgi:hypothetical protein